MNPYSGFRGPQTVFRQPGGWPSFGQVSAQPCFGSHAFSLRPQTFQPANGAFQTGNVFRSFTGPNGSTSCPSFASFGHGSGMTQGLRQASSFPCRQPNSVTPGYRATPPFNYQSMRPQGPVFGRRSGFVQPSGSYMRRPAAFQTSPASRNYVGSRTNNPGGLFEGDRPYVLRRPNQPSVTVRRDLASPPVQPYGIRTEDEQLWSPDSSTNSMASTSFMTDSDSSSGSPSPLTGMPDMETQMDPHEQWAHLDGVSMRRPGAFQTSPASRTYVGSRTNDQGGLFEGDRPYVLRRPNNPSVTVRRDLASPPVQPYGIRTEDDHPWSPDSSTNSMESTSYMTDSDSSSGSPSPLTSMPDMETQIDPLEQFTEDYEQPYLTKDDLLTQTLEDVVELGMISQTTDSTKQDFPQVFQPTAVQDPGQPSLFNPEPASTSETVMGMEFKEWQKKTLEAKVCDVVRTACENLSADLRLKLEKKAGVAHWSGNIHRAVMAILDKELAALAQGRQEDELSDLGRLIRRRLMSFIVAEIQRQNPELFVDPPAYKHATSSFKPQQPEFAPDEEMATSCNTSRLSQDATTSITSQKQDSPCAFPGGPTPSRKRRVDDTFNSEQLEFNPIEEMMSPPKKLRRSEDVSHTSVVQQCFSSVGPMNQCHSIAYHSYSTTLSASPMGLTLSRKRKITTICCSEQLEVDPIEMMSRPKKFRRLPEGARHAYSMQSFSSSVEEQMHSENFGYSFHAISSPIRPFL